MRHERSDFVSDGSGPDSHFRALLTLIAADDAAASCVLPSIRFFLSNLTCSSVTNVASLRKTLAQTGDQAAGGPAKVVVVNRQE